MIAIACILMGAGLPTTALYIMLGGCCPTRFDRAGCATTRDPYVRALLRCDIRNHPARLRVCLRGGRVSPTQIRFRTGDQCVFTGLG